jgi:hypothetical protein
MAGSGKTVLATLDLATRDLDPSKEVARIDRDESTI